MNVLKKYDTFWVLGQNSLKIRILASFDNLSKLSLSRGIASICIFHLFQLPDIVDLELGALSVMVNDIYL